jgi:hypothetical protein
MPLHELQTALDVWSSRTSIKYRVVCISWLSPYVDAIGYPWFRRQLLDLQVVTIHRKLIEVAQLEAVFLPCCIG